MAELTYDDVRRAVQTVSTSLQSVISDIKNSVQNTRTDISRLSGNEVQSRLNNIERALGDLNQYMHRVDILMQNTQPLSVNLQHSFQYLQRLEQRMANIEQLSADMTTYLHAVHDATLRLTDLQTPKPERLEP